jgi:hypothetical protein
VARTPSSTPAFTPTLSPVPSVDGERVIMIKGDHRLIAWTPTDRVQFEAQGYRADSGAGVEAAEVEPAPPVHDGHPS